MNESSETARVQSESGFTLIELIIASAMSVVVMGAAVAMLISALQMQPKLTHSADQVGVARVASERIVNELRQGSTVYTKTPTTLSFLTFVHASPCTATPSTAATAISCRVTYTCSTGTCVRSVTNADGTGTPRTTTVVTGASSSEVFCYMPSTTVGKCGTSSGTPTYVGIKLVLPASSGGSPTTLEDGATLRGATLTN